MAQDVNAVPIARGIESAGDNVAQGFKNSLALRKQIEELRQGNLIKLDAFLKLPATTRQRLLQDPDFRKDLVHTMSKNPLKKEKAGGKELPEQTMWLDSLGAERPEETASREKVVAESQKAVAEAALAKQKERLSTGVEKATPMSLLIAGDVKDPIANAMFSLVPQDQLKAIALNEHKAGPMYLQTQMQEWYKWGITEGLPPGLAMTTASAIANGKWDEVPTSYTDYSTGKVAPVRGKAERELAISATNALANMQSIQNTIANSIATSATQLAEKAGIPLDQARADIMAMRAGKPAPFPTPHLEQMALFDSQIKSQEIEKNAQTILNDKSGIGMIKESLNALTAQYKEAGSTSLTGSMSSAQKADLADKMNALTEELSSRLAGRYGIKFESYDTLHPGFIAAVKKVISSVGQGLSSAGAWTADMANEVDNALGVNQVVEGSQLTHPPSARVGPNVGHPTVPHTPEQKKILEDMAKSFDATLKDETVPIDQKKQLMEYINNVFKPAYTDPSKFLDLFRTGLEQPQGATP